MNSFRLKNKKPNPSKLIKSERDNISPLKQAALKTLTGGIKHHAISLLNFRTLAVTEVKISTDTWRLSFSFVSPLTSRRNFHILTSK